MKPTVGRIVHVTDHGRCLAAIVTFIKDEDERLDQEPIGAVIFEMSGSVNPSTGWRIYRGEPGEDGRWHWPELIPADIDRMDPAKVLAAVDNAPLEPPS